MTAVRRCCTAMWKKKVHVKMADIYHERQVKELCALHALNNLFQNKVYDKSELDGICETLAPNSWFNPHKSMLGLGNYDVNVILIALQSRGYEGIWFDKRNTSASATCKTEGMHPDPLRQCPLLRLRSEQSRAVHWYASSACSTTHQKQLRLRSGSAFSDFFVAVLHRALWFETLVAVHHPFRDPQSINLSNIVGFILNTPSDYKFCIVTIRLHRRHWVAIREIEGQYYNLDSKNDTPQVLGDERKLIDFLRAELKHNDRELFIVVTQEVEKNHSWLVDPPSGDTFETRT